MRMHWSELVIVDDDDGGVVKDELERRKLLEQLKRKGKMRSAFLTRTWGKHENPTDRKTWGPPLHDIDWSGF